MKLYYNIITEYDWNDKTCIIIIIVQVLEPDDGIISHPYHCTIGFHWLQLFYISIILAILISCDNHADG